MMWCISYGAYDLRQIIWNRNCGLEQSFALRSMTYQLLKPSLHLITAQDKIWAHGIKFTLTVTLKLNAERFFVASHKREHMFNTITLSSKLFHSTLVILRSYAWEMSEPFPTFYSSESFNTFLIDTTRIFHTNIWIHTKCSLDLVNYNSDLPFEITFQPKNSTNNEPNYEQGCQTR